MVRQGQPTAGTAGSTVDHVTFRVRDPGGWAKGAGITIDNGTVTAPDGIAVRVVDDASLTTPSRMESISISTTAPDEAQALVCRSNSVRSPGSRAGGRGSCRSSWRQARVRAGRQPTGYNERKIARSHRLRSEEPRGILQELEAAGIKLDRGTRGCRILRRRLPSSRIRGAVIELTENLAPARYELPDALARGSPYRSSCAIFPAVDRSGFGAGQTPASTQAVYATAVNADKEAIVDLDPGRLCRQRGRQRVQGDFGRALEQPDADRDSCR